MSVFASLIPRPFKFLIDVQLLILSPEARKGTSKLLVKGAALALEEQVQGLTTGVQN
nr:hypothetical protein [Ectobacillus panaciterrae]